ncbi:multidrug efflux pump subunit AcrA (membrane-fusion protein) [Oxalobacteraceae bacterium GrIS 1.11]
MNYIYWSEAALALADRQTRDMSEGKANELLRRRGNYRNPSTGELFPFPAPEPSNELLEKFPALATMPRDSNAKLKLLHSRAKEYENILLKLADAGEIIFYDPATLLRIWDASEVKDPMVDMDKIAAQIIQYSETNLTSTARPNKTEEGITKNQILAAFDSLVTTTNLSKAMADGRQWAVRARVSKGTRGQGGLLSVWNPLLMAVELCERGLATKSAINKAFLTCHFLTAWREQWNEHSETM